MHRFAPAAPDEPTVHGACCPGWAGPAADDPVAAWIDDLRGQGVERVCCLLPDGQLARYDDLLGRYRVAFGADRVLHAPIRDHHLAEPSTLTDEVLPFFAAADDAGEPVVAHCLAGVGRTGQALAAWLVAARGYDPREAVATVEETGRHPRDAVQSGNATEAELFDLLETVGAEWDGR